jgi:hypothetical protein
MMYWPLENTLYVEGYALDEFASGSVGLVQTTKKSHAIGLLLDKGIEENLRLRHLQVADAARATLGINVARCVITDDELGVETSVTDTGASWGSVRNVQALIDGARKLVQMGCTAIAVVARFPEEDNSTSDAAGGYDGELFDSYRKGEGVDAIAGVEALISHTITKHLGVPCAHAPAFAPEMDPYPDVAPKAAAEELGFTFLPCVLANLHRAPQLVPLRDNISASGDSGIGINFEGARILQEYRGDNCATSPSISPTDGATTATTAGDGGILRASNVDSVVVPHSALGGSAVLSFLARGALVVAVQDNDSAMDVTAAGLGLGLSTTINSSSRGQGQVVTARSYMEAAGIVMAHRQGIYLPALGPTVAPLSVEQ